MCIVLVKDIQTSISVCGGVKEIKYLEGVKFAHVISTDNPAGMATRGKSPEELSSSIWWNGLIWLTKPNQQWPDHEAVIDESSLKESEVEIKGNKVFTEPNLYLGRIP